MAIWLLALLACDGGEWDTEFDTSTDTDTDTDSDSDRGALTGLGITPFNPTIDPAGLLQFRAEGVYEDGSSTTLYDDLDWTSSNTRVAEIDSSGKAFANDAGTTDITVKTGGFTATVTLTVTGAEVTLQSVSLSPSSVNLLIGDSAQVQATGTFSDSSTGNIAGSCTWESSHDNRATVDSTGKITAVAEGTATISALCEPLGPQTVSVTVEEEEDINWPTPNLEITAPTVSLLPSGDVEYTAKIRNTGTGYAQGFWVDAILDSASAPTGASPDADQRVPGLGAGDIISVVLTVIEPPAGTYSSWLVVDPIDEVTEQDENDNTAGPLSITVDEPAATLPDLEVTDFYGFSDTSGTVWSVEFTNDSTTPTAGFWVDIWESWTGSSYPEAAPGLTGDQYVWVSGMTAGESQIIDFDTTDFPTSDFEWDSCILVDSGDDIEEDDEDNNLDCQYVTVF